MFISGYLTEEDFKAVVIEKKNAEFKLSCSSCGRYVFPVQFERSEIKIEKACTEDVSLSNLVKRKVEFIENVAFVYCSLVYDNEDVPTGDSRLKIW